MGTWSDEVRSVKENWQLDEQLAKEAGDFTASTDPFYLFAAWYADAEANEINDPNAMALATVDNFGLPNLRTMLLKDVDPKGSAHRGFVFYTNLESAKALELKTTPRAALLFHWKSLRRQVRIRGTIDRVSDQEADDYFASRPRLSQIGAWASDQSRPLSARHELEEKVAAIEHKYADRDVPRPPHWSGYRLIPVEIEFWHSREHRLHDRVVFRRAKSEDAWEKTLLYP